MHSLDLQLDDVETRRIVGRAIVERRRVRPADALATLVEEAAAARLEIIEFAARMASAPGRIRPSSN